MKKRNAIIGGALLGAGAVLLYKKLTGTTIPEGAVAIRPFDLQRYLGKWYEIARLDYRFEHNLVDTTAEYSLNDDGSVKVVNRGYDNKKGIYEEAVGRARFIGSPEEARLKVSFFGPFYAAYNVIAIDEHYKYALVVGKDLNYLWLLSRKTYIPNHIEQEYLNIAAGLGYNIADLIWVDHKRK